MLQKLGRKTTLDGIANAKIKMCAIQMKPFQDQTTIFQTTKLP